VWATKPEDLTGPSLELLNNHSVHFIQTNQLHQVLNEVELRGIPRIQERETIKTSRILDWWSKGRSLDPIYLQKNRNRLQVRDGRHRLRVSIDLDLEKVAALLDSATLAWLNTRGVQTWKVSSTSIA